METIILFLLDICYKIEDACISVKDSLKQKFFTLKEQKRNSVLVKCSDTKEYCDACYGAWLDDQVHYIWSKRMDRQREEDVRAGRREEPDESW